MRNHKKMADSIFETNIAKLVAQADGANEQYSALVDSSAVSDEAKLIGAAILLSGAQIATALYQIKEAR
jgi:hypothetical protein